MVLTTRREIAETGKFRFPRPTERYIGYTYKYEEQARSYILWEYSNLANIWMNYTYNVRRESRCVAQS